MDSLALLATFTCEDPAKCYIFADSKLIVAGDEIGRF